MVASLNGSLCLPISVVRTTHAQHPRNSPFRPRISYPPPRVCHLRPGVELVPEQRCACPIILNPSSLASMIRSLSRCTILRPLIHHLISTRSTHPCPSPRSPSCFRIRPRLPCTITTPALVPCLLLCALYDTTCVSVCTPHVRKDVLASPESESSSILEAYRPSSDFPFDSSTRARAISNSRFLDLDLASDPFDLTLDLATRYPTKFGAYPIPRA